MLRAQHETGLVFFPAFDWAISPTHPEREERLLYTQDQVIEEGLFDIQGIHEFKPDPVTLMDVQRVHFCVPDPWKVMTESHFISAGGAKTIGMAVLDGQIDRGFALVRPPGHHASADSCWGFCYFNNMSISLLKLFSDKKINTAFVLDFDLHTGDGNINILEQRNDGFHVSILNPGSDNRKQYIQIDRIL